MVSDNTDYLVVGEGPGSKLDEAKKRKVKRIDEKGFKKLIS
jgi:NAD-dependent DNA ligase